MIKPYYYKITVHFTNRRPRTVIRHYHTDDKRRVEDRIIRACKLKFPSTFAGLDIWIVKETDPGVQKYKEIKGL